MKNEKVSIIQILKYAGAFAACAIGSGFATGQEIMQFFSAYGQKGIWGTIVTAILFTWCGATFMRHGYRHKLTKPKDCTNAAQGTGSAAASTQRRIRKCQ